jgi:hypothetical protein
MGAEIVKDLPLPDFVGKSQDDYRKCRNRKRLMNFSWMIARMGKVLPTDMNFD